MSESLQRICWVFPDRESARQGAMWKRVFWDAYQKVAAELGMSFTIHAPDAITVDGLDAARPRVFVDGERVHAEDTAFITALYSLPYHTMDVFNQYAIYAVLEHGGYYLPIPPWLSAVVNDKLATNLFLAGAPIPPIPTVRIGCGRDIQHRLYEPAIANLTYPAIVKPAGWASGWGVNLARSAEDLRGLLSLAQGGETTLVAQPYLGAGTSDYRLHIVEGRVEAVLVRSPTGDAPCSSRSRGGTMSFVDLPDELASTVDWFTAKVPTPYFCVDFLHDGERFWLSEIETDGAIGINPDGDATVQHDLIAARFSAYRRAHAAWREARHA